MAADMFLKIEPIKGESKDEKHTDELELLSINHGVSQSGSFGAGGGGGVERANWQDFSFSKYIDKASPVLEQGCALGTHYVEAIITCRKAGGKQEEYYIVTLNEVLVTSYTLGLSEGGGRPIESFTLNYQKIKVEYKEQAKDGTMAAVAQFTYNIAERKSA